MSPRRHLVSTVSLTSITLSLSLWMIPLIIIAVLRPLVPARPVRRLFNLWTEFFYRRAAAFNSWWITTMLGVELDIEGERRSLRNRNVIIVSNHRSWFDILVLHAVTIDYTSATRFLIKRELVWVPVVGWICLALDFPRLNRSRAPKARERDYQAVADATTGFGNEAVALLNFAEGTRFTREKHESQASPWRHLLKPKMGGLRIMLENTQEAEIMDITLAYPAPDWSFWRCLSGELPYVKVYIDYCPAAEVEDAAAWLEERWAIKDQRIDAEFRKTGL